MGKESEEMSPKSTRWNRDSGSYSNEEMRVIKFRSIKEINRLIDLCWIDPDLIGLPRDYANGKTMFVPAEAIDLLKAKKLKFTTSKLGNPPPDELARQRHKYGL